MNVDSGQPEALKRHNRAMLMSLVELSEGISRASLARLSNLSRTTVSHIINELLEFGLLCEVGNSFTGGRRATILKTNPDSWFAIGAELDIGFWNIVMANMNGEVIRSLEWPCPSGSPRQVLSRLAQGVQKLRSKTSAQVLPAVGIGVPGLIDMDTGVLIRRADDPSWVNVPVQSWIQAELRLPVRVINRHKACGLAEARYGAGIGLPDLLYIGVGSGISGALFSKGDILYGASFGSGEVGHITVWPDGPQCTCGNNGCLQTLASGKAIMERVVQLVAAGQTSVLGATTEEVATHTAEEVCQAAKNGDKVATTVVDEAGRYLGIVIAGLINTLNPSIVVMGGTVGLTGDPLLSTVRAEIRQRALAHSLSASRISVGRLGRQAGAIGAASLILEQKLNYIFDPSTATLV